MQNPRQIYRLRARASGREAIAPAEPGGVYIDRETGEEMEPVTARAAARPVGLGAAAHARRTCAPAAAAIS